MVMNDCSIIRLIDVADGRMRIKINSLSGFVVMNLQNEFCEPLAELGETLLEISSASKEKLNTPQSFFLFWQCDSCQYALEFILQPGKNIELQIIPICNLRASKNRNYCGCRKR
ncbi:MAG: hypothetical protein PHH77_08950 [Victivallaceae bacterium]|nr:hypothetical protein [Victivallaceae bacterium]